MLDSDIELIEGLPALYIKSLRAVVVSDLHLGYEGGMVKSGLALPKANLKSVLGILEKAIEGKKTARLIIVGDVKNEFSGVLGEEVNELREIVGAMSRRSVAVEVVKGNHDNFLDGYSKGLGITLHREQLVEGGYLFAHGDKEIKADTVAVSTIIIGHEHPSVSIRSRLGVTERLRCFLHGAVRYGRRKVDLIVLPAIGYFETGSDVNVRRDAMSPVLRRAKGSLRAIAIGYGATLDFGPLKDLQGIEV